MKDKLIRRAAIKYRNWIIETKTQHRQSEIYRIDDEIEQVNEEYQRMVSSAKGLSRSIDCYPRHLETARYNLSAICRNIIQEAESISSLIETMARQTEKPISLTEAIQEISVIDRSWDTVFREGKLSIIVENIILNDGNEDVELGRFRVVLDLLCYNNFLRVESIDKICPKSTHINYHPHINNNKLCLGEGFTLTTTALHQGRLEDYFRIIEATLRTYNKESPHLELSEWYNPQINMAYCDVCEENVPEENTYYCEQCGTNCCNGDSAYMDGDYCCNCDDFSCSRCIYSCSNCNDSFCNNCATTCNECEDNICGDCKKECPLCERIVCPDCNKASCEHCCVPMCDNCLENHQCLLKETS